MKLYGKWRTVEGAKRAGRRDAMAGEAPRTGSIAFPGSYMDAYRTAAKRMEEVARHA